jgi:phosphate-selective porin OprO/OprP
MASATLAMWAAFTSAVGAQSPPPWPTPVVTATPVSTAAPETAPPDPPGQAAEPAPTPPSDQPKADGGAEPQREDPESAQADAGTEGGDEKPPESGGEVNPGEVAFTDFRPFDLDEIQPEAFGSKWKGFVAGLRGLGRYSLFDGKVKFRIGGKAQFDGVAGSGNSTFDQFFPPIESEFKVRRFEAYAAGRIKEFNFTLAFELGPDWGLSDAWIEGATGGLEVWGHFLGKLRVGLMNEPFSLERQTSTYNTGFLERSLPVQTMAPGSNIGAMVHDSGPKGHFTWAFGLFSVGQQNDANASGSLLSLTGRATFAPVNANEGRDLVHFGISLSSRSPNGATRYRSRPEARFVDYLVDTGDVDAARARLWGLEAATVRGPLWMAAEYLRSEVSAQLVGDPVFSGSYVQVGWFLTGESRPYRANSGIFDRLRPRTKYTRGNPFRKRNGGAWELVGRLSTVDLTDADVRGGKLTDFSGALNWYINATTRVELNYIHARPEDQGSANIFLLRVQYQPW